MQNGFFVPLEIILRHSAVWVTTWDNLLHGGLNASLEFLMGFIQLAKNFSTSIIPNALNGARRQLQAIQA